MQTEVTAHLARRDPGNRGHDVGLDPPRRAGVAFPGGYFAVAALNFGHQPSKRRTAVFDLNALCPGRSRTSVTFSVEGFETYDDALAVESAVGYPARDTRDNGKG